MLLTVTPKWWLSRDYEVHDASGLRVGDVRVSSWRAAGTIRVGEAQYAVSRHGAVFGAIAVTGPTGEVARAVRQGVFARAFAVEFGGRSVVLRSPSMWFREMRLLEADLEIGSAVPEGVFSRRAQFDLPESLSIEQRLFIVWLVVYVWSRRQDSPKSFSGVLQAEPRRG